MSFASKNIWANSHLYSSLLLIYSHISISFLNSADLLFQIQRNILQSALRFQGLTDLFQACIIPCDIPNYTLEIKMSKKISDMEKNNREFFYFWQSRLSFLMFFACLIEVTSILVSLLPDLSWPTLK